ncbi:interferon-induced protein 44-like isoform X1 [Xyrauchen texanus]|uniref:interferon-induced protein 44-like isoform X1 n=1 Tax=Xyrauchen texanus TaxID=154827 RepID=UPI002241DDFC|nr:interferon-induced protein 44-like isoform X1 [Xyrauchen texanus]
MGGSGSKVDQTPFQELETPWRTFDWNQKKVLKERLESFAVSNTDVKCIKVLVTGQIGAGKSSFINSVLSTFQGEIVCEALADAVDKSHSFTKKLTTYRIKRNETEDLPFVIIDMIGIEPETLTVQQLEDIMNTIQGHVKENYKFKIDKQLTPEDEEYYKKDADISDQVFCLVYVLDTNYIATNDRLFDHLRTIRLQANDKGIPQVIVMTKVDEACPLVKKDLRKIYTSRKIKQKIEVCSASVGVPISNIFPVKNYHNETDTNDDVDVLILKVFDQIVRSANARLRRGAFN